MKVSPWLTFTMDVCMVGLLFACKPENRIFRVHVLVSELMSERRFRRTVVMVISWLSVAVPVTMMMTSVSEHSLAELGTEFIGSDGRKTTLLEPETWTGKEFPLLPYIEPPEVREQLKTGEWTVVLYHHDCPKCKETISELVSKGTPNVVCIEMPPYGDAILPQGIAVATLATGNGGYDWFVETPCVFPIHSGVIR